ncbi:MAG: cbb3-type cytochrome c oxidase subunit I, partial [Lentisphaeraceae bacterium]|nr:cbb3-type cytochrome c oxidase subunit I [Lentisphaeraceae bacterium]
MSETGTNYINHEKGLKSWLTTIDHKRIGLMYLWSVVAALAAGGFFALMIRFQLAAPELDLLSKQSYNQAFTLHGVIMVFLFIIPAIPAALGNFVLPIMVG